MFSTALVTFHSGPWWHCQSDPSPDLRGRRQWPKFRSDLILSKCDLKSIKNKKLLQLLQRLGTCSAWAIRTTLHRNLAGWFLTATALGTEHPRSPTCQLQVIPKFTSFHIQKMRILNVFNDICTLMYIWCIHIYSIYVRVHVCVCLCRYSLSINLKQETSVYPFQKPSVRFKVMSLMVLMFRCVWYLPSNLSHHPIQSRAFESVIHMHASHLHILPGA